MPDAHYPDNVRMHDSDPRSPFYSNPAGEDRAEREEECQESIDCIEAATEWLANVCDIHPDEADEDQIAMAVAVDAALHTALKPWAPLILASASASRADQRKRGHGPCRPLRLFGVTLPVKGADE